MIRIENTRTRKEKDSTIALINIVFLMLVFFLIAGTIVPPLDSQISPILSGVEQNAELENTISVRADGTTYFQGNPITPADFVSEFLRDIENSNRPVRILSDKDLGAVQLVDVINQLQSAGAPSIRVVTERKGS
ncbi:MAG: biopolymer transporter ExbD [Pseudomonadota bacterium]